jgi:hypothetical protein
VNAKSAKATLRTNINQSEFNLESQYLLQYVVEIWKDPGICAWQVCLVICLVGIRIWDGFSMWQFVMRSASLACYKAGNYLKIQAGRLEIC